MFGDADGGLHQKTAAAYDQSETGEEQQECDRQSPRRLGAGDQGRVDFFHRHGAIIAGAVRGPQTLLAVGVVDVPRHQDQEGESGLARQAHRRTRGQQRQSRQDAHAAIAPQGAGIDRDGCDQGGHPEDQECVGDVRSHDIAEGDARRPGQAGLQACGEFGRRGAHTHHRQADEHRRETESLRYPDRPAHEKIPARNQQDEA